MKKMKKMKTLALLFLAVIMSTTGLVSCIDEDLDPAVQAIYSNQAALIAAQAGVQNAEAVLRTAQAAAEQAQADLTSANADNVAALTAGILEGNAQDVLTNEQELMLLVAETARAVDSTQNVLATQQVNFEIAIAKLIDDLNEVGVGLALEHASSYDAIMVLANGLMNDKLETDSDLAEAELMVNSLYMGFGMTALEMTVIQAANKVEFQEITLNALMAVLNDPASLPAQVTAWEAEIQSLKDASRLLKAEAMVLENQAAYVLDGAEGEDALRQDIKDLYEGHQTDTTTWNGDIQTQLDLIEDNEEALTDYAGALAAAELALGNASLAAVAADQAVTDALEALGISDNGALVTYAFSYSLDADGASLAVGGVKYAAPANVQEVLVNAIIDALDANKEHYEYSIAYGALVITYNDAATALAAAQDMDAEETAVTDAETDLGIATTAHGVAKGIYLDAQAAFALAPDGSNDVDGPMNIVDDLGEIGIVGDGELKTYMRVIDWEETSLGSGEFIPSMLDGIPLNEADLLADIAKEYGENGSLSESNIILWEQDGTGMDAGSPSASSNWLDGGASSPWINNTEVGYADMTDQNLVYYLEVETGDTSVPNLFTFNVATNELGQDDFALVPIIGDGSDSPLVAGNNSASYDDTPGPDGTPLGGMWKLTAEAVLWNAEVVLAEAEYNLEEVQEGLAAAILIFAFQEELFDEGVLLLAGLKSAYDTASIAAATATDDVVDAWSAIGPVYMTPNAGSTPLPGDNLREEGYNALIVHLIALDAFTALQSCDEPCLQEHIVAAQHEISLIQPKLDVALEILAEMKVEYDEIMEAYIAGDLDADVQAEYNRLMHDAQVLLLERAALQSHKDYIAEMLTMIEDDNLEDISAELETLLTDLGAGSYNEALEDLTRAEQALAEAMASQDGHAAYIAYLESLSATLAQRIDNHLAQAAIYMALMEAALQS
jgi:hypothetical protein